MSDLTKDDLLRYSRHLALPEVGIQGQRALKNSRILIVGMGGLGSPAALYLAAAGVGCLGLVDFDVVEYSNLQRQIIHGEEDVGKAKLISARNRIVSINSGIDVVLHEARLTSRNAFEVIGGYDIVIDGTDNFPTRYLVNDACVISGKPYVYGSIYQFEGQVSLLGVAGGPCYRCLFPEPPPPGEVPSCAEGGVLGVLPGIIGTLQAAEALKFILRKGELLVGRLIYFDALRMSFREIKFRKNSRCAVCGDNPEIRELIDYEGFCGIPAESEDAGRDDDISPAELHEILSRGEAVFLLDVREPQEFEICRIAGARLLPMGEIPENLDRLDLHGKIVVYCHHGIRSRYALDYLKKSGFTGVKNLKGGIDAWARQIETSMPRY